MTEAPDTVSTPTAPMNSNFRTKITPETAIRLIDRIAQDGIPRDAASPAPKVVKKIFDHTKPEIPLSGIDTQEIVQNLFRVFSKDEAEAAKRIDSWNTYKGLNITITEKNIPETASPTREKTAHDQLREKVQKLDKEVIADVLTRAAQNPKFLEWLDWLKETALERQIAADKMSEQSTIKAELRTAEIPVPDLADHPNAEIIQKPIIPTSDQIRLEGLKAKYPELYDIFTTINTRLDGSKPDPRPPITATTQS